MSGLQRRWVSCGLPVRVSSPFRRNRSRQIKAKVLKSSLHYINFDRSTEDFTKLFYGNKSTMASAAFSLKVEIEMDDHQEAGEEDIACGPPTSGNFTARLKDLPRVKDQQAYLFIYIFIFMWIKN